MVHVAAEAGFNYLGEILAVFRLACCGILSSSVRLVQLRLASFFIHGPLLWLKMLQSRVFVRRRGEVEGSVEVSVITLLGIIWLMKQIALKGVWRGE